MGIDRRKAGIIQWEWARVKPQMREISKTSFTVVLVMREGALAKNSIFKQPFISFFFLIIPICWSLSRYQNDSIRKVSLRFCNPFVPSAKISSSVSNISVSAVAHGRRIGGTRGKRHVQIRLFFSFAFPYCLQESLWKFVATGTPSAYQYWVRTNTDGRMHYPSRVQTDRLRAARECVNFKRHVRRVPMSVAKIVVANLELRLCVRCVK